MTEMRDPPTSSTAIQEDEITIGADRTVMQAMRGGYVAPTLVLECIYYAAESELLVLMRAFAGLDPATRSDVLSYTQALVAAERGRRRGN
jgi:hypothetical protein